MVSNQAQKIVRTMSGVVISNKMKNAIVVEIERTVAHPKYKKIIRRSTKLHAQDIGNTAGMGDEVVLQQCRPVSKTIAWKLVEIKKHAV